MKTGIYVAMHPSRIRTIARVAHLHMPPPPPPPGCPRPPPPPPPLFGDKNIHGLIVLFPGTLFSNILINDLDRSNQHHHSHQRQDAIEDDQGEFP